MPIDNETRVVPGKPRLVSPLVPRVIACALLVVFSLFLFGISVVLRNETAVLLGFVIASAALALAVVVVSPNSRIGILLFTATMLLLDCWLWTFVRAGSFGASALFLLLPMQASALLVWAILFNWAPVAYLTTPLLGAIYCIPLAREMFAHSIGAVPINTLYLVPSILLSVLLRDLGFRIRQRVSPPHSSSSWAGSQFTLAMTLRWTFLLSLAMWIWWAVDGFHYISGANPALLTVIILQWLNLFPAASLALGTGNRLRRWGLSIAYPFVVALVAALFMNPQQGTWLEVLTWSTLCQTYGVCLLLPLRYWGYRLVQSAPEPVSRDTLPLRADVDTGGLSPPRIPA